MSQYSDPIQPAPVKPAPVRLASGQAVSLGCGTLLMIVFIVWFFSGRLTENIEKDLRSLQSEVKQLQQSVQEQTSLILQLKEQVEKLKERQMTAVAPDNAREVRYISLFSTRAWRYDGEHSEFGAASAFRV